MILTWALILAIIHPPCYADGHNAHRSQQAKRIFMRLHPCPGGPDKGSTERCAGYVIDHICPLACCGDDAASNMQWQTLVAGHRKDRWEMNCKRSCK